MYFVNTYKLKYNCFNIRNANKQNKNIDKTGYCEMKNIDLIN